MHHIATWRNVLKIAREQKLFDDEKLASVEEFLNAPGQVVCGPWRRCGTADRLISSDLIFEAWLLAAPLLNRLKNIWGETP